MPRALRFALAILGPALPCLVLLGLVMAFVGADWSQWWLVDWLAISLVSVGGLASGLVSVGVVSTGIVSVGVVSFGVFSFGLVSTGSIAIGVWVAGLLRTKPIFTGLWERKFALQAYSERDQALVLGPLQGALAGREDACLLDLACGTGRMTRLALGADWFKGRVDASDYSAAMLGRLGESLAPDQAARVAIVQEDLNAWPGRPAGSCDAAALMEVSEMLSNLDALLPQVHAALKPGAPFVLTRTPAPFNWFYPGRGQSRAAMRRRLEAAGFEAVAFTPWTWRYEIVTARRAAG